MIYHNQSPAALSFQSDDNLTIRWPVVASLYSNAKVNLACCSQKKVNFALSTVVQIMYNLQCCITWIPNLPFPVPEKMSADIKGAAKVFS